MILVSRVIFGLLDESHDGAISAVGGVRSLTGSVEGGFEGRNERRSFWG